MTLSTPLVWIGLPLLAALIAGFAFRRKVFGVIFTGVIAFGLALLALTFPENMVLSIGPVSLIFNESLGILGRQITISYEILPFISLIYFVNGLWILMSGFPGVPLTFRPASLVITALLTASLGVEPFLYAALLIETAVLVSIPMLSPLGKAPHPGILRYLTLQTLAMPFILLAGWLLTGVEALPPDSPLVLQSALVLGLGIALWLAVFPFHSWVPMLSERSNPIVIGFLRFIIPAVVLMFSLNFINRYTFLRESEGLYRTLRIIGTIMIVIGGGWTAFQDNLRRAFGFSTLTETGFSLLAIGLASQGGLDWLFLLMPIRAMGYWLWSTVLTLFEGHTGTLTMQNVKGLARRYPLLSIGLLLAQLSVAGLPLLAAFPIKIRLLTAAFADSSALGIWGFLGSLGLFLFTIRLLAYLVTPDDVEALNLWEIQEQKREFIPVLLMIGVLLVLGLFPQTFLSNILQTLTAFSQLQ